MEQQPASKQTLDARINSKIALNSRKKTLEIKQFTEMEMEIEQDDPPIIYSVSDSEKLHNPDSTDLPSFLGQNYENRDCTRVLRSHNKSKSQFHPFARPS